MARFRYLGEPPRDYVETYGPTVALKLHGKSSVRTITPIAPATSFQVGSDIGYDITDERELRHLRNDPRFAEIV